MTQAAHDKAESELDGKITAGKHEIDNLKKQLSSATEGLRRQVEELEKKLAAAEERCDTEERTAKRWFEEKERLAQKLGDKDGEIAGLQKAINDLKKQLGAAEERVEKTLADRDRAVADGKVILGQEVDKVAERDKALEVLGKSVKAKEKEAQDAGKQIEALQAQLKEAKSKHEQALSALREQMDQVCQMRHISYNTFKAINHQ